MEKNKIKENFKNMNNTEEIKTNKKRKLAKKRHCREEKLSTS